MNYIYVEVSTGIKHVFCDDCIDDMQQVMGYDAFNKQFQRYDETGDKCKSCLFEQPKFSGYGI